MEGIQVSTQSAGAQNQISIIKVGGYIDTTTSAEVERSLNALLKQGRYQIIIDLGNVDYISSAGWGIFISEIKAIRENNGDLKLVQMIPDVYEIFELLEFHHILDVYDSVQEAINKFEESQFVEMVSAAKAPQVQESSKPSQPFSQERPQQPKPQQPQPQQQKAQPQQQSQPRPVTEQREFAPKPVEPKPSVSGARFELPRKPDASASRPPIISQTSMSTEEKIRHIVELSPELGAYKINRRLNSADYGYTKVGWFNVRSYLNRMGLNSGKRRLLYSETKRKQKRS